MHLGSLIKKQFCLYLIVLKTFKTTQQQVNNNFTSTQICVPYLITITTDFSVFSFGEVTTQSLKFIQKYYHW